MTTYEFGNFVLDPTERALSKVGGESVGLQDLPLRLLIILVERAPQVVGREALRLDLWPPGTHLDLDASLNTAVARVREALGDDATSPRFVATVPRRGYRFVAPVEVTEQGSTARRGWAISAAAIVLLALSWLAWRGGGGPGVEGLVGVSSESMIRTPAAGVREQLLIARHHADKRSREGLEKAIAAFQSALALDAESSEAFSGLASTYALLGIYDFWRPREALVPAETMARRAIELDSSSAESHLALGLVAAMARWDWATSLEETAEALELAPSNTDAWYWRGMLLSCLGRHDESIASLKVALELDPTSPVLNTAMAWLFFMGRRDDLALAQGRKTIELFPDYYDAWDNLKWIQRTLGNEAGAVEAWIKSEELAGDDGEAIRRVYSQSGLDGLHRESIATLLERWKRGRYQSPYDVVLEYAALGDIDNAMVWLERSFEERETDLVHLAVDPRLDVLRSSLRFAELVELLELP